MGLLLLEGLHSPPDVLYPILGGNGGPHILLQILGESMGESMGEAMYAGDHFLVDPFVELVPVTAPA